MLINGPSMCRHILIIDSASNPHPYKAIAEIQPHYQVFLGHSWRAQRVQGIEPGLLRCARQMSSHDVVSLDPTVDFFLLSTIPIVNFFWG